MQRFLHGAHHRVWLVLRLLKTSGEGLSCRFSKYDNYGSVGLQLFQICRRFEPFIFKNPFVPLFRDKQEACLNSIELEQLNVE